jgi:alkylhydroperoxidase/carboxymuconolactone decarboxylase family protein YurZ
LATPVTQETRETLAGLAAGRVEMLELAIPTGESDLEPTGLDARTFALVRIAVLIALDAPPSSYSSEVSNAVDGGAKAQDFLGVLRAVAPQVGATRVVAAAPELMLALRLSLQHDGE